MNFLISFKPPMQTHFANVQRANESDNTDHWDTTVCGLEYTESPLTDRWEYVSCKNCLRGRDRHEEEMKYAMEQSCKDMEGFVEFHKNN